MINPMSVEISHVANGWLVRPPIRYHEDVPPGTEEIFVFPTLETLFEWFRKFDKPQEDSKDCPDIMTALKLSEMIRENKIPSPWRDGGEKLNAFGKWLGSLAGRHG